MVRRKKVLTGIYASFSLSKCYLCYSRSSVISLILASSRDCLSLSSKGEMQQLKDKLAITDRAAKSEAQLKVNGLFLLTVSKFRNLKTKTL